MRASSRRVLQHRKACRKVIVVFSRVKREDGQLHLTLAKRFCL